MGTTAFYSGSFDPFHLGHEDIVRRGAKLFGRIIVGIGVNPEKRPTFSVEERVRLIRATVSDLANVEVESFEGLTVRHARKRGATVLVRGIRALADIEYEFTMSLTNSSLDPELDTVFLMPHREFAHLSSTLIRQIAQFGGDLTGFVPPVVRQALERERDAGRGV
jgi:pantetheine-phosphate adenylyltransferase